MIAPPDEPFELLRRAVGDEFFPILMIYVGAAITLTYIMMLRKWSMGRRILSRLFKVKFDEVNRSATIEEQIAQALTAVSATTKLLHKLDHEIKERVAIASNLKSEVEKYSKIKSLSEEQLRAVTLTLDGQFERHNKKAFWSNFFINFLFMVVGGVVVLFGPILAHAIL